MNGSCKKKLYWIHSCQIFIGFTWKTYAFLTSSSLRGPARGRPRAFLSDWDPTIKGSSQDSLLFQVLLLWDWVVQLHPSLHWNPDDAESLEYEDFWDWFVQASLHFFSNLLVASASKLSSVCPSLCHPIQTNKRIQSQESCDISTKKKLSRLVFLSRGFFPRPGGDFFFICLSRISGFGPMFHSFYTL